MHDNLKGGALTETTFLILLSLHEPNHGYGIMQFIENKTNGRVSLGAGTLYGALNTLVKKKLVEKCNVELTDRKKQYIITTKGKKLIENEISRLKEVLDISLKITRSC